MGPRPVDIAECTVLAAGVVLIVAVAVAIHRRGWWREALRLPEAPPNRLEGIDVLLAIAVVLLLPSLTYLLLGLGEAESAASQPAEGVLPTAQQSLAAAAGQTLAVVFLLFLGRSRFPGGLRGWGLSSVGCGRRLGQAACGYLAIWPACFGLLFLTRAVIHFVAPDFPMTEHPSLRLLRGAGAPRWLSALTVVSAVVLAPAAEELLFRGILLPALARVWRPWTAVIVSGIAFGLIHYPLPYTVPTLAVFGMALGWAYCRTGSLTLVILMHAVFNGKPLLWLALGAE